MHIFCMRRSLLSSLLSCPLCLIFFSLFLTPLVEGPSISLFASVFAFVCVCVQNLWVNFTSARFDFHHFFAAQISVLIAEPPLNSYQLLKFARTDSDIKQRKTEKKKLYLTTVHGKNPKRKRKINRANKILFNSITDVYGLKQRKRLL